MKCDDAPRPGAVLVVAHRRLAGQGLDLYARQVAWIIGPEGDVLGIRARPYADLAVRSLSSISQA
jgi:hypothetical protein